MVQVRAHVARNGRGELLVATSSSVGMAVLQPAPRSSFSPSYPRIYTRRAYFSTHTPSPPLIQSVGVSSAVVRICCLLYPFAVPRQGTPLAASRVALPLSTWILVQRPR